jgi:hypothetical protein
MNVYEGDQISNAWSGADSIELNEQPMGTYSENNYAEWLKFSDHFVIVNRFSSFN